MLGVTATVRPLPFPAGSTVDLATMIGASLLLASYLAYLATAVERIP